jgi:hypothetical protein
VKSSLSAVEQGANKLSEARNCGPLSGLTFWPRRRLLTLWALLAAFGVGVLSSCWRVSSMCDIGDRSPTGRIESPRCRAC